MNFHTFLIDVLFFLIATLTLIPLFRKLRLGTVLGYIIAGMLIGPMALGLISNSENIHQLADFGIILLLFMVGLELSPERLRALRRGILIEGAVQVFLTTGLFYFAGIFYGLSSITAFIIGISLSLSSTAFALSYLTDTSQLTMSHGQTSLSILLFQDLLVVPILAIIPLLAVDSTGMEVPLASTILLKLLIFLGLIAFCFFGLKPAIRYFKKAQDPEIFLAAFLVLIVGMSIGMERIGLSKEIGAFVAGIFLANSEIKKDIKSRTLPFKGILMGVFFMSLGMEFDFLFIKDNLSQTITLCIGIFCLKAVILLIIGRFKSGNLKSGIKLCILISQAGEFSIIILASALQFKILDPYTSSLLITSIILTMILSPLLARATEFLSKSKVVIDDHFSLTKT